MVEPRYESPFTARYGSPQMHSIWADRNRQLKYRDVWIAQAQVQQLLGLVTPVELDDLISHRDDIDVDTINRRELDENDPKYTGHDALAALSQFADVSPIGARILHLADTSEDLFSNAEVAMIDESIDLVEKRLTAVVNSFGRRIDELKDTVCMGFTHLQAAEPTTMGYRLARYARDFITDLKLTRYLHSQLKGKGIKGPVGTSAGFVELLQGTHMSAYEHETFVMNHLGILPELVTGQTYPRKTTLLTVINLALIGQSAYQFAGDIKLLQSSPFAEMAEPRRSNDKSSSSMMHKRNPRHAENIKALSASVASKMMEAWIGAATVTLERGLEDSAGKRSYLPESFLATDEILIRTERIIRGLQIREMGLRRNLEQFGPFTALEQILTELTKRGAHRQKMDALLREHAGQSIEAVESGQTNPLRRLVATDTNIHRFLKPNEIEVLFDSVLTHVGDAGQRCQQFLECELYPAIQQK